MREIEHGTIMERLSRKASLDKVELDLEERTCLEDLLIEAASHRICRASDEQLMQEACDKGLILD